MAAATNAQTEQQKLQRFKLAMLAINKMPATRTAKQVIPQDQLNLISHLIEEYEESPSVKTAPSKGTLRG